MLFFDVEARPIPTPTGYEYEPYLGVVCYLRRRKDVQKGWTEIWEEFEDMEDMWRWILGRVKEKNTVYICAHNIQFDLAVSRGYDTLIQEGWEVELPYIHGRTFIARAKKGKRRIILIDTMNFFPYPLREVGEMVGLTKGSIDYAHPDIAEARRYCRRDVEIIREAMLEYIRFIQEHQLGRFSLTLAQQTWSAFRSRRKNGEIYIHSDPIALSLERDAFFGGRCEAFFIGDVPEEEVYELDINSAYPYVMATHPLPVNLVRVGDDVDIAHISRRLERYHIIADVLISTDEPVFPLRCPEGLIFPVGTFRTTLATPELRIALDTKRVRKIFRLALYERGRVLAEYVQELLSLRQKYREEGNRIYEALVKLLANALFGKFAQKQIAWEELGRADAPHPEYTPGINLETGETFYIVQFAGKAWQGYEEGYTRDAFPAVAAHISSYLRVLLWSYMKLAGRENVYYCDTDSLMVGAAGLERLRRYMSPDEVGRLKLRKLLHGVTIYGKKQLVAEEERRLAGIPASAVECAPGIYEYEEFPRFRSYITNHRGERYRTRMVQKRVANHYPYGRVTPSGWVEPLVVIYRDGENIIQR